MHWISHTFASKCQNSYRFHASQASSTHVIVNSYDLPLDVFGDGEKRPERVAKKKFMKRKPNGSGTEVCYMSLISAWKRPYSSRRHVGSVCRRRVRELTDAFTTSQEQSEAKRPRLSDQNVVAS